MEPVKKYDCDEKLNILGPEIGKNPDAFDEDAWMELFEASMLAAEQQRELMSAEELEEFTAKNLAGFEGVKEKGAAQVPKFVEWSAHDAADAEKNDKEESSSVPVKMEAKSAGMTVEEILEKSSEIEADLAKGQDIVDITEPVKKKRKLLNLGRSRKGLLLVASVTVLGLGTTMVTQGNRWYELRQYPIQAQRNVIANHNSVAKTERNSELKDAYKKIAQTLDITVYELGDVPLKMVFERLILDKDYAALKFNLDDRIIYFKQRKVPNIKEISDVVVSDRTECAKIHNEWMDREIVIEKNVLDDGLEEYSAGFIENDVLYYLSGIMDEDVFSDLVKGIHKSFEQ